MSETQSTVGQKMSAWQTCGKFIWNSEKRAFCGRTGFSWFQILFYYVVFYGLLLAFWGCMLLILYQTIDTKMPKWYLSKSRIGTSPGVGFRPFPDNGMFNSLIWFNTSKEDTVKHWGDSLKEFLKEYGNQTGEHFMDCNLNKSANWYDPCRVNMDVIKADGKCPADKNFGFADGQPCVLLKLNRIFGWRPEPFDSPPQELTKALGDIKYDPTMVYITCSGENSFDEESIGHLEYYPSPAINDWYFPFLNQVGYLSPFVFVKFTNITRYMLVFVECRAWAKNIQYNRHDRVGSVHFELLVDGTAKK